MTSVSDSPLSLRPLLDINQSWAALELGPKDCRLAAAANLYAYSRDSRSPPPLPWLIHLSAEDWEAPALPKQLPPGDVLLLLPESCWSDPAATQARLALIQKGYRLGADVTSAASMEACAEAGAQLLRVSAALARDHISPVLLHRLKEKGITLMAVSVHNHDLFVWCGARGFTLLSGEFLSEVEECPPPSADPSKLRLLKLLSLIVQDADTRDIEEMIKQEPKLSYNLLRLVNSVSVGASTKITSFSQAITLLGRRQLQRWLQLLIYANQFNSSNLPNPLMPQAALRGRLVELIALAAYPDKEQDADFKDCAYMVGAFSLLDVLLRQPMSHILAALPLCDDVAEALEHRQGTLGQTLALVESLERGLPLPETPLLAQLRRTRPPLGKIQVEALSWVRHIDLP